MGEPTYAGQLMAIWFSILSAFIHEIHGNRQERSAFFIVQFSCLACGALEAGAIESGVPLKWVLPARLAMVISFVSYVVVVFLVGR